MIPHATRCSRPAPVLRQSWAGRPETWCPSCGRYAPAPNARQEATSDVPGIEVGIRSPAAVADVPRHKAGRRNKARDEMSHTPPSSVSTERISAVRTTATTNA